MYPLVSAISVAFEAGALFRLSEELNQFIFKGFLHLATPIEAYPSWKNLEPVKSLENNYYTEGEIMGDHRCENCGKMFYTRYVQHKGNCLCQECSAKKGLAKKEKEYREAKEYWKART